jgi:hypothetical protein
MSHVLELSFQNSPKKRNSMPVHYLYLDDESIEDTQSIADLLKSENKGLKISVANPLTFAKQIQIFKDLDIDGLILDLRLDQIKNNNEKAEYRASTLAQEIRTRSAEGLLSSFPIVICSTDSKLKKSYDKAIVGQDLFDVKYLKNEEMIDNSKKVADELVSLANGYRLLNQIKKQKKTVGLPDFFLLSEVEIQLLDQRLVKHFFGTNLQLPLYEYARFILKEMIIKPGVLVDEVTLLGKLGVSNKSKDLNKLLEKVSKFKYKGPFHDGWERWWWPLVNHWWYTLNKGIPGLANLNSKDRVEILSKYTGLKLTEEKPISANYSTKFGTVCQFYRRPLDSFDGLLIDTGFEVLPWQDSSYVSLKAAADPKFRTRHFSISATEKQRLDNYKRLANE